MKLEATQVAAREIPGNLAAGKRPKSALTPAQKKAVAKSSTVSSAPQLGGKGRLRRAPSRLKHQGKPATAPAQPTAAEGVPLPGR